MVRMLFGWIAAIGCAAATLERLHLEAAQVSEEQQLAQMDLKRGICVLLGDTQGRRALDLARTTELTLFVQSADPAEVRVVREAADRAGLLGTRVFVAEGSADRIGMADNLADAVLVLDGVPGLSRAEVLRVLRPLGQALFGKQILTKPFPKGVDDWSHHYHGPDNNPQSRDRVAKAPYWTQFIAEPRYAPAPQAAVSSAGRLFMAFGHVAWHEREEPWMNTLVAMNAFNGTILWKRPLVPGIMVDRSTLIATPERLYLADDKSCKVLDAAAGRQLDEIVVPADRAGGTFWKWMALEGGTLYALIGPAEPPDPDARWRSTHHGWPWDAISRGYNASDYLWGFGPTLVAIDPRTHQLLWIHQEDPPIDSRSLCMAGGRIYFAHFGRYLACLDAQTGQPIWRRTADRDAEVFEAIGPYRPGHGYIGGWKSTVYMKCTSKCLYVLGPQVEWLTALSAADGRVLWRHLVKDLHLVIRDDGLYVTGPENSTTETKKLDPLTGRVLATFGDTRRRACTRSTGSCDAVFFRGHEGSGRLDVTSGRTQWISTMRPSCHIGVLVANGHLYWVPWACDCNLQMFGAIALAPAGAFAFDQKATETERLEVYGTQPVAPFHVAPTDWPTQRANGLRTAQTEVAVADRVERLWQSSLRDGVEPTAPVAAGGRVFVAGSDGAVRAFDAATGQARWVAYTGGPIGYAPTVADGRVFVGSSDGWAYAFEAATGRPLWRFRAAPVERRIPVYGALISTWPVGSGVLVHQGVAYFACGLNDFDGTHVYAVDAATGRIRWQNNTSGHLDPQSRRGVTCQGEMLLHEGKLYLAGGNTVSPAVFDAADGRCLNPPPTGQGSHAPRGRELYLVGHQVRVTGQPLYSIPSAPVFDPSVQWTVPVVHAKNADLLFRRPGKPDRPPAGKNRLLSQGSPVRAKAPGSAADVPASDPWCLVAINPLDKQEFWSQTLEAEPVRWGMALDAHGRILVSLRNGRLLAFGPKP